MRLLLQRVKKASVSIAGQKRAEIGPGLLVLAGFGREDSADLPGLPRWNTLLDKMLDLRIFPDDQNKMNLSLRDWNNGSGELLLVSQFTLYADCRKGRRPSFDAAAPPALAAALFDQLHADLAAKLPGRVQTGVFGADMDIGLVNWGPVTLLLEDIL